MNRLFAGLLGLILAFGAFSAEAGMNIRQNGDGSTDWQDASGNNFNVGAVYLTVTITDISTASSAAIAVPIPNAHITSIRGALHSTISGTPPTFKFWTGSGITYSAGDETSLVSTNEVSNATNPMSFTANQFTGGATTSFSPSLQHAVGAGYPIIIRNGGESTGTAAATLTIVIEPDGD